MGRNSKNGSTIKHSLKLPTRFAQLQKDCVKSKMVRPLLDTIVSLRSEEKRSQTPKLYEHSDTRVSEEPENEESWIVCRQCRQRLCRPSEGTVVNGAHRHTFANPSGIVFEIACYRNVQGCSLAGPPSTEFSWFAGHSWQIIICSGCLTHLGWRFNSNQGTQFHGFIVDRIDTSTLPRNV